MPNLGATVTDDNLVRVQPFRHQVQFVAEAWRCVECGELFPDWPSDDEPCLVQPNTGAGPGPTPGAKPDELALWAALGLGEKPRDAGVRLGIPPNRVEYLCGKWARQGIYDYGVVCDLGWIAR